MITMLTDFGHDDVFVGVMKGVILGVAPKTHIVDLTHEVPPQDIMAAAFHLACAIPYFAEGTIHLVVVDPGVGTTRRAVVARTKRGFYVAPDNGVLTLALRADPAHTVVSVENPKYRLPSVSATFHGRDVFAPAAGHLANGVDILNLGPEIADLVELDIPHAEKLANGEVAGKIMHVDRFGNCITNIPNACLFESGSWRIAFADQQLSGISTAYATVAPGVPVAVWGSSGYLELAVRDGSAARQYALKSGADVRATPA